LHIPERSERGGQAEPAQLMASNAKHESLNLVKTVKKAANEFERHYEL